MVKIEYRIVIISTIRNVDKMLEQLNELGQDGWEAFHIISNTPETDRVFLKREGDE